MDRPFKKISVIGLGYIGLPTAAIIASRKINVIGVDVNPSVVETINRGEIQIVEPDLDIAVHSAVTEGYLKAVSVPEPADAFMIAVPTPFLEDSHQPDLRYVESATRSIAPILKKGNLIVLESTSPVGTTEKLSVWLAEERSDLSFPHQLGEDSDIRIAYCPERVLPGHIMQELIHNDRIVAGMTAACTERTLQLYQTFVSGDCLVTNSRTAELVKLTENSFRDVNIAFANEMSLVCDRLGVDVWEVIRLANRHPRVNILQPGPGVGGHCIAVDPWFIVSSAPEESRLIRTAREVNDHKPIWVLEQVRMAIGKKLMQRPNLKADDVKIALYGIAFKPDIDDTRESPALSIAQKLDKEHPGPIYVVEPNLEALPKSLSRATKVDVCQAKAQADIHVLLVAHTEFRELELPEGSIRTVAT